MRVLLATNEYPPYVYGGAGVHVEYLSRELAKLTPVEVRSFHDQTFDQGQLHVRGIKVDTTHFAGCPQSFVSPLRALSTCLAFVGQGIGDELEGSVELIHCHTWYTHFSGILAKILYNIPMVITVHSLEPLRPWKREQLGGGYDFTVWLEATALKMADAVIAVSEETKVDLLRLFDLDHHKIHVIHNGIDLDEYQRVEAPEVLRKHGVDPAKPYVLFVGRITRQKGIIHLVRAIEHLDPGFQVVLCAGAPDTPEIKAEMEAAVAAVSAKRPGVVWIQAMLPVPEKIAMYSHADVFCCPSIYEPFGIINLEAMACETAVVASAVGGIKEVVVHGETGLLIPLEQQTESPFEALHPEKYAKDLADGINALMRDDPKRKAMAVAGRKRAVEHFSWKSIARKTMALYKTLAG